jgi:CBS domain containing-hemolysin-like protein
MSDLLNILIGIVLLAINFFFVLAEFALVRLLASRVDELIAAGDRRAKVVRQIQTDMDSYLSVVQVGITGATLGIGVLIEEAIAAPIAHLLGGDTAAMKAVSHGVGFLIATFVVILTSELLPKSIAIRYAEPCALVCARPMVWTYWALFPFLWLMTRSAQGLMRLMGLKRGTEEEPHSEDELRIILDASQEHGLMSFRRLLFMENIFEMGELRVKDAMRPRSQVRCLHTELAWKDTVEFLRTWPFSRFPLIDTDPDKPVGMIHVKDLLYHRAGGLGGHGEPIDLRTLARPVPNVLNTAPLETVFADMQRRRLQTCFVVNEEGAWVGLVTFEDILEEIVGTIGDEFESEAPVTLSDHLTEGRVVLGVEGQTLAAALRFAFARIPVEELPTDADTIQRTVLEREKLAGTYLGKGIALPHARIPNLPQAALLVLRSTAGIPVEGSKERARLLFVLLTPAGQPRVHQRLQARIAGLIENSEYVEDRLLAAESAAEVVDIVRTGEQASLD